MSDDDLLLSNQPRKVVDTKDVFMTCLDEILTLKSPSDAAHVVMMLHLNLVQYLGPGETVDNMLEQYCKEFREQLKLHQQQTAN